MLQWAKEVRINSIELPFAPTKKNNLVKDFLVEVGFDSVEADNRTLFKGEVNRKISHHAKIMWFKERNEYAKISVKQVNKNF